MTTKTSRRSGAAAVNLLEKASREVERSMLLVALRASGWSLKDTAAALGFVGPTGLAQPASVLRKIRALGLQSEYDANKPRPAPRE